MSLVKGFVFPPGLGFRVLGLGFRGLGFRGLGFIRDAYSLSDCGQVFVRVYGLGFL